MCATTRRPCPRCNATGIVSHHRNVLGGVCFRCRGAGTVRFRPGFAVLTIWASGEAQLCFVDRTPYALGTTYNDADNVDTHVIRANDLAHINLPGDVHNPSDELVAYVRGLA